MELDDSNDSKNYNSNKLNLEQSKSCCQSPTSINNASDEASPKSNHNENNNTDYFPSMYQCDSHLTSSTTQWNNYFINNMNVNFSQAFIVENSNDVELIPGTIVQIPAQNSNNNTHCQNDSNFLQSIGLVLNQNTVAPLNATIPMFDSTVVKMPISEISPTMKDLTNDNILLSSKNAFNQTIRNDISLPPPLQITSCNDQTKSSMAPINDINLKQQQQQLDQSSTSSLLCYFCGNNFTNQTDLYTHLLSHNVSYNINENSSSNNEAKKPSKSHQSRVVVTLEKQCNYCKLCGYALRTINVYDSSLNTLIAHSDKNLDTTLNMEVCDNCGKEYQYNVVSPPPPTNTLYNNNMNNNTTTINTATNTNNAVNVNVEYMDNRCERFFCQLCNKSYKHNRDLRKHEKVVHGLQQKQLSKASSLRCHKNKLPLSQFMDKIGNDLVLNQDKIEQHSDIIGGATSIQKPSTNNCKQKPKNGDSTSGSMCEKYFCDKCNKSFRGPFELRRHIMTIHENNRPFKCHQCGKLFRDTYELKRHTVSHNRNQFQLEFVEDMTTPMTNFSVDCVSQANFNNIDDHHNNSVINVGVIHDNNYMHHKKDLLNTSSTNNNTSSITIKQENFFGNITPKNLINNIPRPSTQSDYYCGICDKNFRGANEFKRHYSVVHEKKYRYKCVHCGKLWRDQYDLKRHCRRSHFLDRDIDKSFIRQCLLENYTTSNNSNRILMTINNLHHSNIKNTQILPSSLSSTSPSSNNSNNRSQKLSNKSDHDFLSNIKVEPNICPTTSNYNNISSKNKFQSSSSASGTNNNNTCVNSNFLNNINGFQSISSSTNVNCNHYDKIASDSKKTQDNNHHKIIPFESNNNSLALMPMVVPINSNISKCINDDKNKTTIDNSLKPNSDDIKYCT